MIGLPNDGRFMPPNKRLDKSDATTDTGLNLWEDVPWPTP